MNNPINEFNYRALYGKLFSALTSQFGIHHIAEIEDAIQNSFLKSIKNWKPDNTPKKKADWLFISARNDLLNQLKRNSKLTTLTDYQVTNPFEPNESDLRLDTILVIASSNTISKQAKIVFVLKNIFGLGVREIVESTLLGTDAIYKITSRAKTALQKEFKDQKISAIPENAGKKEVPIVEEILYAIFNTGFDSFNEKYNSIINEDLCLESLALAKLLFRKYYQKSTSNLLSLFCFHAARINAKVNEGKLVSFFNQDRSKWNNKLINLGFHYLKKSHKISKFYIEALIVSKYMSTYSFTKDFWNDIAKLYEILLQLSSSPIIELNYCFCLNKIQRKKEAIERIENIESKLPSEHIYLSLVKAALLKETDFGKSEIIAMNTLSKMNQEIRKRHLLESDFINL